MSESLLIADCGATSGKWAFVDHASGSVVRFVTGPVNPSVYSAEDIAAQLAKAVGQCPKPPSALNIYAAGALGGRAASLAAAAAEAFGTTSVTVETDLVGAARGLLGDRRGIVCILGTGSNSCLWSGSYIEANMPPMGYILGDEGSGASIGMAVLRPAIRHMLPPELMAKWDADYPALTYGALVEEVYGRHAGSGYVASFVSFVRRNIDHPAMEHLVTGQLRQFVDTIIAAYPEASNLPLAFTGGVANAFAGILTGVVSSAGMEVDSIVADPLDMLVERALSSH